jgi:hypothetical protein
MTYLPAQSDPPLSPRQTLPTMYDLPSENPEEPGLPDEFHSFQPSLLRQTFKPANYDPEEIFVGADINLYYNLRHPNWYKRPDWFAVLGVSRLYEGCDLRLSYVLWQGSYENIDRLWLRWMTIDGELIPIPSEEATVAEQRALAAEQQAAEARQRAERLAARLRELGVDPEELE